MCLVAIVLLVHYRERQLDGLLEELEQAHCNLAGRCDLQRPPIQVSHVVRLWFHSGKDGFGLLLKLTRSRIAVDNHDPFHPAKLQIPFITTKWVMSEALGNQGGNTSCRSTLGSSGLLAATSPFCFTCLRGDLSRPLSSVPCAAFCCSCWADSALSGGAADVFGEEFRLVITAGVQVRPGPLMFWFQLCWGARNGAWIKWMLATPGSS